ncbi:glycerophosphodiester phosphodiesterase family protein [Halorubrum sp. AD140]|uniref:glycerophosphodiester phosphodiesterase n=1 Tax=Halorubrum sp. AD140 TaxID=3050073 RepID=UPI002ACC62BC|nr:glycerophosphodiester phosphodiesterase family protein [Halorubrum sp. AD140]MDZ5809758.1 glycerophosphodiester phosphodiesterase family protein [Halorubrum sp. AD140]
MTDSDTLGPDPTDANRTAPGSPVTGRFRTRRAVLRRGAGAVGSLAVVGSGAGVGSGAVAPRLRSDPPATETDSSPGGDAAPPLVAHRGCAADHPENTVAAVEAAAAVVDRIELDVRRCGSGELVAFHDATLGRVTDGSGRVDETPYAELSGLDVDGSGEPIPTIEEAFAATPSDVRLLLDLKEPGLIADLRSAHAGRDHDLLLSSFHPSVLEEARATAPELPTAYAVRESVPNRVLRPLVPGLPAGAYAPEAVEATVDRATELGCQALCPRYELCLQTDLVARARDAGLRVLPWTIASEREYEALRAVGVDAVVSDACRGLRG